MLNRKNHSVAGILFKDNYQQVLLIKRRDLPVWTLPGGGIEPGESTSEAALREFQEETGYQVKIKRKVAEFLPKNKLTKITHLYECEILSGSPSTGDETADIAFFPCNALPQMLPPPYAEWIQEALMQRDKPIIKHTESASYPVLIQKILKHPILVAKHFLKKWKFEIFHD